MEIGKTNPVHIIGGGLAGLTAAIGIKSKSPDTPVIIYYKKTAVDSVAHSSVHVTPLHINWLSRLTGINFSSLPGIAPLPSVEATIYTRSRGLQTATIDCNPFSLHIIRRGDYRDRESLDYGLHLLALEQGAQLTEDSINLKRPPAGQVILATGLDPKGYKDLGIPTRRIRGYYYRTTATLGEISARFFFSPSILRDYFYSGRFKGLDFGIVFDSAGAFPKQFEAFIHIFSEYDRRSPQLELAPEVAVPNTKDPFFYKNRLLLAGTISPGMIDPVFYFGIVGAIISGHIAATAVTDSFQKAEGIFKKMTANYRQAVLFRKIYDNLPCGLIENVFERIAYGEISRRRTYRLLADHPLLYQWFIRNFAEGIPGMPGYLADCLPKLATCIL